MTSIRNKKRPIFLSSSRHPRLLSAPAFISSWDVCSTGAEAGRTTSHYQTFGPRQDARACRHEVGKCEHILNSLHAMRSIVQLLLSDANQIFKGVICWGCYS